MKCLAEVLYEIVPFAWVRMITLQAVAFVFLDCCSHAYKLSYIVGQ